MTVAVSTAYTNTHASSEIDAQASLHFNYLAAGGGASGSGSNTKDQAEASFTNSSAFSASIVGGDPTLAELTDWDKWLPTFYNAPAMVSYQVRPVSDMIEDPVARDAVNNAMQAYVGGPWGDNCTNASETIAGLERRLADGASTWRIHDAGGGLAQGFSVTTSPSALMGIQAITGTSRNCLIRIYDASSKPDFNNPPKLIFAPSSKSVFGDVALMDIDFPAPLGVGLLSGIYVRGSALIADNDMTNCDDTILTILYK